MVVTFQEREKLLKETQDKEEKLKKEMEAKEALAAKIKVSANVLCSCQDVP